MKTLGQCNWVDIKVGEVFAEFDGVVVWIHCKIKEDGPKCIFILAQDYDGSAFVGIEDNITITNELHRLSLKVQRNWYAEAGEV